MTEPLAESRAGTRTRESSIITRPRGCFVLTFSCARYAGTGGVPSRPGLATLSLEPGSPLSIPSSANAMSALPVVAV
jgi:hypothetical protein